MLAEFPTSSSEKPKVYPNARTNHPPQMALGPHELREKQRKEYSGEYHMTREKIILGIWLLLQNRLLPDLIRSLPSAPKWTPYLTDLESVVG